MTDLSKFDGHTNLPWNRVVIPTLGGETMILINGKEATDTDLALMGSAPALLARVKELEEALNIVAENASSYPGMQRAVKELLNKEWL